MNLPNDLTKIFNQLVKYFYLFDIKEITVLI
jgi:hypothetical protein